MYIEDSGADLECRSVFDPRLDLRDCTITLLLKPGHYDVLYNEKELLGEITYDQGFSAWIEQIFVNKEKEKEAQYNNSIVDKITLSCCRVVFSKEEYMKSLIQNNIHSEDPGIVFGSIVYIRCICGESLDRHDLMKYFSFDTVDRIYDEIKSGRRKVKPHEEEKKRYSLCYLCKREIKESNEYEYDCTCGVKVHDTCMENEFKSKGCPKCLKILTLKRVPRHTARESEGWILPCCREEIQDKEILMNALVELNRKKKIAHSERVICPFCSRTLDRVEMAEIFTNAETERILKESSWAEQKPIQQEDNKNKRDDNLTIEKCSKCTAELSADSSIPFECAHRYHILCAKSILEANGNNTTLPTCAARNCGATVYNRKTLLDRCNDALAKNCACCDEPGSKLVVLKCGHYVCKKCGENFRSGKNKYFVGSFYEVEVDCKICDYKELALNIILQCGHTMSFSEIRTSQRMHDSDRGKILTCKKCSCTLNDVELYATLGKEKADKELAKIDKLIHYSKKQHESKKRSEEELKKEEKLVRVMLEYRKYLRRL